MALPNQHDLLKKAVLLKKEKVSKSVLNNYRTLLLFLKLNNYSMLKISKYLNDNGIKISYPVLRKYMINFPFNDEEMKAGQIEFDSIKKQVNSDIEEQLKDMYGDKK